MNLAENGHIKNLVEEVKDQLVNDHHPAYQVLGKADLPPPPFPPVDEEIISDHGRAGRR